MQVYTYFLHIPGLLPSDSTSYACDSSLNLFSASSLFSGFLSGCHFSASFLYLIIKIKTHGCWNVDSQQCIWQENNLQQREDGNVDAFVFSRAVESTFCSFFRTQPCQHKHHKHRTPRCERARCPSRHPGRHNKDSGKLPWRAAEAQTLACAASAVCLDRRAKAQNKPGIESCVDLYAAEF